jgi:TaqI-like C-terminal specificity domain/Eco57I restriction-modification methylase/N-6 DNA Methylase
MPRIRRSADQHPELGLPEVRKLWQTESLFSDHYLKKRIRENSWWPTDAEAQSVWEFCKALYEKRAFALRRFDNEMGVRQEFIDKILGKLGFAWSDNLRLPETQQELEPDYLLYASEGEKETVLDKDVAHRYRAAISILEAKRFGHPLSQFSKSQQRYPHQQIRHYLDEAQVFSWGILTNGEQWRLYCRDTKPSHFFAINFELAIKSREDFKFFFALFSPVAFKRDAQGECRLDDVRKSALDAQSKLEEDLRQRVFTIVEILANGFAEREQNAITDTAESRRELYGNCLIFLYRLLFVLYAEGRMLLPVERSDRKYYKDFSLAALRGSLRSFSEFDSPHLTRLNDKIVGLCRLINGTDEKLNKAYSVPLYNGGLFAPERHPLLEEWRVSDAVLADVLRGLMFNPQPERDKPALPIETVDFGDLRVQQLGSIYEGLLEHHFVREGARLVLKTDKAERKATGTYYTPDYIVKYIVEQTVGPLVAEIEEREPVKKARAAGLKDNSFAQETLALNVLDPAMGSGHFLVEATTFLADEIAAHPTTQPLGEKSKDEDEIAHWRRRVVESCIYGVDLNPLAVELTKLSLWLTTIATDRPLNFLDHHFCCGNSLVGARIGDLGHVPELRKKKNGGFKFTWRITDNLLAAAQKAVRNVKQIEERASDTVGDVKNKEKIWSDSVRPALRPFRSVANLWVACFFGNDLPQRDYEALIELLDIHPDKIRPWKNAAEFQEIVMNAVIKGELKLAGRDFDKNQLKNLCAFLIRAEKSAHERRFFHWELEFPEVFFNDDGTPRESPGFDVVIGNPPYGLITDADTKSLVQKAYASTQYQPDFYVAFIERADVLTREHGYESLIVPTTFLTMHYFSTVRRYILDHCRIETLVHFKFPVFADPTVVSAIYVCLKEPDRTIRRANSVRGIVTTSADEFTRRQFQPIQIAQAQFDEIPGNDLNLSLAGGRANIVLKMRRVGAQLLGALCEMTVGVKPYQAGKGKPKQTKETVERRVFDADHRKDKTYHQYLMGRDLGRYVVDPLEDRWISYGEWLAESRPGAPFFEPRRVVIRQTGDSIIAAIEDRQRLTLNNIHNLKLKREPPAMEFLLAILNSRLVTYYHQQVVPEADRVFAEVKIVDLEQIPFPRVDFTTPATKRATQLDKANQLYEKSLTDNDAEDGLQFVKAELKGGRTDVVHDLLAFLAERMMAMNQQKRTTVKQFLTDLQDFHGIEARALNPKTKLNEFWKLEPGDVFAHLRKNTKLLAAQKVRLTEAAEENIRSRFQKAKEKLLPLEAEIAFTDHLIDQIVYRLYGLTEQEIQLVEENSKR